MDEVVDLEHIIDYLERERGLRVKAIVGHSKGGAVAMMHAVMGKSHRDVMHISVAGRYSYPRVDFRFTPEQMAEAKEKGSFVWRPSRKEFCITHAALRERRHLNDTFKTILPRVACPVLHVHGTEDKHVPMKDMELMKRSVPGIEVVMVPGADHNFKYHEVEVSHIIREFIAAH